MKLALALLVLIPAVLLAADAQFDGHKVYYDVSGKGEPTLVLVHGWTCDATFWAPQIADFSKQHRVLAIDLPGHGRSDKPEVTYDLKLFARAVLAAMDAAKIQRAVLMGHSMGLPVIRTVYAEAPSRVSGLVSVDGALFGGSFGDFPKTLGGPTGLAARRKMVENMFVPATSEALRTEIVTKMLVAPEHVAVSAMANGVSSPLWSGPPAEVPALAIQKKGTNSANIEKNFRAAFTNLDYREMEGVGHFLQMEKPAEFNAAVLEWIAAKVPRK